VTQYLIKLIVQLKTINTPEKKKQYGIVLVSKISKELSRARRAMRYVFNVVQRCVASVQTQMQLIDPP